MNAGTEPQVVPGQPRLANERSWTCSVKVARVGVRQPFLHLDSPGDASRHRSEPAYAVTTPERVEALPDLPTTAEAGLEGVDVSVWHGVYVPAETPDDVVAKITDALAAALTDQAVVAKLAELGAPPAPAADVTPEAHRQKLQEQIDLWAPIIKESGVTAGG